MASDATPQQSALLNRQISIDQDDWENVLGQLRSAGNTTDLTWLEVRALGELGHVDKMIMTYASAESALPAKDLPFCRLYVLSFSGSADAVRSLLNRQLRFVRPRNKACWIFIAGHAADTRDEDARRVLASYVHVADGGAFRRTAQRHLDAEPRPAALSTESRATIAAIEKALG